MRFVISAILIFGILVPVLWLAPHASAQYYGPYAPRYYQRYAPPPRYAAPYHGTRYYLRPDVQQMIRWRYYQRMLERDQVLRSPLNPESSLDYMLRTW